MQVILRLSKKEKLQGIPLRRQQKYCKLLTINFLILYILKNCVGIKFIHEYLEQQLTFGFFFSCTHGFLGTWTHGEP